MGRIIVQIQQESGGFAELGNSATSTVRFQIVIFTPRAKQAAANLWTCRAGSAIETPEAIYSPAARRNAQEIRTFIAI